MSELVTLDSLLMMMEMGSRSERELGTGGWVQPPSEFVEMCEQLVDEGLAEQDGQFFRPTEAGAAQVSDRIHKVS